MKIQVNNKEMEVVSPLTLDRLIRSLDLPAKGIAVAVNNRMIPRTGWENYALHENDSVVAIRAACGG